MGSRVDVWLSRISQISQVGFFALAIFGFFYTVIPLYQNQLLNEAVAQKEVRLKHLQTQLDELYTINRKQIINMFVFYAGADCSGLLQPPQPYVPLGASGESSSVNPMVNFLANHSTVDCFVKDYDRDQRLMLLRPEDRDELRSALITLGKQLDVSRHKLFQHSTTNQFDAAVGYSNSVWAALQTLNQLQWPAGNKSQ